MSDLRHGCLRCRMGWESSSVSLEFASMPGIWSTQVPHIHNHTHAFCLYLACNFISETNEFLIRNAGLATHYINADKLDILTKVISDLPVSESTTAAEKEERVRQVLDELEHKSTQPRIDFSKSVTHTHIEDIRKHFADKESVEEIVASLTSDAGSGHEFARKHLETLQSVCPTSLKITHELIRRAKPLEGDHFKCLTLEYNLVQGCIKHRNFYGMFVMFVCNVRL